MWGAGEPIRRRSRFSANSTAKLQNCACYMGSQTVAPLWGIDSGILGLQHQSQQPQAHQQLKKTLMLSPQPVTREESPARWAASSSLGVNESVIRTEVD